MGQSSQFLKPTPQQQQRLSLTAEMHQALDILKMPVWELQSYLYAQIRDNPLLEIDESPAQGEDDPFQSISIGHETPDPHFPEEGIWYGSDAAPYSPHARQHADTGAFLADHSQWGEYNELGFTASLLEQLNTMGLNADFHALCAYLIECLNPRGYLDFELPDIAYETGAPLADVTQALYLIQSLQPAGVGARSLAECLILQLAQGPDFDADTIKTVKEGLPLVAAGDMARLALLLKGDRAAAVRAAGVIRALNPIPSQGYDTGERAVQVIPDAAVRWDAENLRILLNERLLPKLEVNSVYVQMMKDDAQPEAACYLNALRKGAHALTRAVGSRNDTLMRVLHCIAELQPGYFRDGRGLVPMTLADVAQRLELHVSTISRTVQDKYIVCTAGTVSLKSLFTSGYAAGEQEVLSAAIVRQHIKRIIAEEDKASPISDEALRAQLAKENISVSRRVIAKYREEMGIPNSSRRRAP